jgi:hypothetical protein
MDDAGDRRLKWIDFDDSLRHARAMHGRTFPIRVSDAAARRSGGTLRLPALLLPRLAPNAVWKNLDSRVFAWIYGLGLLPDLLISLQTRDRQSGQPHAHILVAAIYEGERYLVSMLGESSNWVQDVRATGGAACIRRRRTYPVVLTEVPPDKGAPILRAWCQVASSGRRHLPVSYDAPISAFEAIASDYPDFRIDPMP